MDFSFNSAVEPNPAYGVKCYGKIYPLEAVSYEKETH